MGAARLRLKTQQKSLASCSREDYDSQADRNRSDPSRKLVSKVSCACKRHSGGCDCEVPQRPAQVALRGRLQHPIVRNREIGRELVVRDIFRNEPRWLSKRYGLYMLSGERRLGQSSHSQILFRCHLWSQCLQWFAATETSSERHQLIHMALPTEVVRTADAAFSHRLAQCGRVARFRHTLSQ
jgi:hypothetical protein